MGMVNRSTLASVAGLIALGAGLAASQEARPSPTALAPKSMPRVSDVDPRFQSYNVEMIEVTGGRFWKPYSSMASPKPAPSPSPSASGTPGGLNPDLYEYRPPIDLSNARLRTLAAALGPAYVRVSGTWANSTFLPEDDPPPPAPPPGFNGVLTSKQWRGVVDFANAVDAQIVTSFAISMGTRDKTGVWSPEQARRFVAYTRSLGGRIAAAEFMNEPNLAAMGGAP